jgi:hypothetical protein
MVDCLQEKPKFFQSKKNQKIKHFVLCSSSIRAFGAFSSFSLLRRCLDFGLDFGHSSSLCVPPPFPFWICALFLYRIVKLLSLSLLGGPFALL